MYLDNLSGEQNLGGLRVGVIRYEFGAQEAPVDAASELRIQLIDQERMPHSGVVAHQIASGFVRVQFRDELARAGLYDLRLEEYQWAS